MMIKNGLVLNRKWQFEALDLAIDDGWIIEIAHGGSLEANDHDVLDAAGLLVIPGLVDIHIHACDGFDFCDADPAAIVGMARFLARQGVTTFLGTSMALPEDRLTRIFEVGQQVILDGIEGGAQMRGIHMEGPFQALAKKGTQSADFIIDPDLEFYKRLEQASGHQIKILDVAPERPGAAELIAYAAQAATVSIAHTIADYDAAMAAFQCGASHVTHLFNAMPPFSHRSPGVVGAASDAGATVELICDGIHLHPSVIRSVFKWFGDEKVVLISDAMRACGLSDGEYELGGQLVNVHQGKATLADGTLAGSTTNLMQGLRNAVSFGIPLASAVRSATFNPARVAGIEKLVGSIEEGKRADLLLLNRQLEISRVIIGGTICN